MLTPAHRKLLVDELIRGIEVIGNDFEKFGTLLLDFIVKKTMKHRGLNPHGHPVKGTVDSISIDGITAAEYSAQADYFDSPYTKLLSDRDNAKRKHSGLKELLLLSSRVCGPTANTDLANEILKEKQASGIALDIFDSRRQAEFIVDKLLADDRAIEALSPYLATLERVRTEFAATALLPRQAPGYLPRHDFETHIRDELKKENVFVISGMSGTGKSQTAIAVANSLLNHYQSVIWVDAKEFTKVEDLQAFTVDRRSMRLNLLHLLRDRSSLVILDDLQITLSKEDLRALTGKDSAVIVTRQIALIGDEQMPFLNMDEAKKLLEANVSTACPDLIFQLIWNTVAGHPLALRLLNAAARAGSWDDLSQDCTAIGQYEDEQKFQLLATRLLGRLTGVIGRELAFFLWCNSRRVDRSFAKKVLLPLGLRKLEDNCLIAADRADVVRLHDIVYSVLPTLNLEITTYSAQFNQHFDDHINQLAFSSGSDLNFFNFVFIHHDQFKSLLRETPKRGSCIFCLAHSWSGEKVDDSLLPELMIWTDEITASAEPKDIDVSAICEAIEAMYRRDKYLFGLDAARNRLKNYIPTFTALAEAPHVSNLSRRTALHHKAKALRNIQKYEDATKLFEQLLIEHPHPATKLLLARMLIFTDAERAKNILLDLLETAKNDPDNADVSVTLGAIETLGRSQLRPYFRDALNRYGGLVSKLIIESAIRGFDQAYVSFAAIGRNLKYHDTASFINILENLPELTPSTARDDKEKANWGHILLAASDAIPTEKSRFLNEALQFYGAVTKPDPFTIQETGHAFVELEKFDDAIATLQPLADTSPNPWILQWLSKAFFGKGLFLEALKTVNEAIAHPDPRGASFHPGMYEFRSEIKTAIGDQSAKEDLQRAYDCCTDAKHKAALLAKLNATF